MVWCLKKLKCWRFSKIWFWLCKAWDRRLWHWGLCAEPRARARKAEAFVVLPLLSVRKIWVCLYFQIWLLDAFGQAIFTVFNQVSPVTSSVGPARHTLHTLVFERKSFEFHCLTWKLNRVENTKKQTRKFRKASKVSTWLFNVLGWWKVRARISPFFAQVEKNHRFCGFFRFIPWILSSFFVVFSFSRVIYMFTIPRCSQQWQCCRTGCISGLTTAQLAIECDESPHAVPVAISLESRRIFFEEKVQLGQNSTGVFVRFCYSFPAKAQ